MSNNKAVLRRTPAAKTLSKVVDYADANGWEVARTRGGHLRWTKGGQLIHSSSTPSDWRAVQSIVSQLVRADRQAHSQVTC